jgi:hypothetical protein
MFDDLLIREVFAFLKLLRKRGSKDRKNSEWEGITIKTTLSSISAALSILFFLKKKCRLMRSPSCLCVCPHNNFEPFGRFS